MRELAEQAAVLADKVGQLNLAVEQLGRRTTRSERITILVVSGLILDLILSAVVTFSLYNLYQVKNREAETRQLSLCPLYSLIIGSYRPETRQPGVSREQYDQAFDKMRAAWQALDCTDPIVPPSGK